jgi:hypothetical protein
MNIFKQIGKSIYGPEFYTGLKAETVGPAIKYYLKLVLLVSIIPALSWTIFVFPDVRSLLEPQNVTSLVSVYPAELELKIKDGQFSTNVVEPYVIAVPGGYEVEADSSEEVPKNLVVIDTSIESISPNILKENSALFFITKNSIIGAKDGGLQVIPMSEYKDFSYTLNQSGLEKLAQKIAPILKGLLYFAPLFIYIGLFSSGVMLLIFVLIFALFAWLILVIKKNSLGYKYAFRVTVHAFTLGLIADFVYSSITGQPLDWLITGLLTMIIVFVNIKKPVITTPPAETPIPPAI